MSATASASPKAQGGQARQPSQGPRVNNGAQPGARKAQNGSPKPDGARRSPQPSAANGKQAQSKAAPKAKASPSMSDFLRQRGATIETANMVSQLRADLGNYYSEEAVYNALVSNSNNVEATRASLTRTSSNPSPSQLSPTHFLHPYVPSTPPWKPVFQLILHSQQPFQPPRRTTREKRCVKRNFSTNDLKSTFSPAYTESKETSWASKVSPVASRMAEPIPAPAVIAHAQQTGARRRIKTSQPQKSASPSGTFTKDPSDAHRRAKKSSERKTVFFLVSLFSLRPFSPVSRRLFSSLTPFFDLLWKPLPLGCFFGLGLKLFFRGNPCSSGSFCARAGR